jgi:hypothetical protein
MIALDARAPDAVQRATLRRRSGAQSFQPLGSGSAAHHFRGTPSRTCAMGIPSAAPRPGHEALRHIRSTVLASRWRSSCGMARSARAFRLNGASDPGALPGYDRRGCQDRLELLDLLPRSAETCKVRSRARYRADIPGAGSRTIPQRTRHSPNWSAVVNSLFFSQLRSLRIARKHIRGHYDRYITQLPFQRRKARGRKGRIEKRFYTAASFSQSRVGGLMAFCRRPELQCSLLSRDLIEPRQSSVVDLIPRKAEYFDPPWQGNAIDNKFAFHTAHFPHQDMPESNAGLDTT